MSPITPCSVRRLPMSVRPPRVRTKSFPPSICRIYRRAIPGSFWTSTCFAASSLLTALYVISVRQTRGLPTPSFRFCLTTDTLGVQLYPSHYRAGSGLSPVRFCPCRAHKSKPALYKDKAGSGSINYLLLRKGVRIGRC